ncbi:MAG: histidine phosphatase family protein [Rhodoferax sp.]|nr:histidine phosphatase family protein [Rhodoferax sp.]
MDLVLWRHAEAQEWVEGCHDPSRALTPKGEKQAAKMASWLDRHLPDGAKVLVSPALRAEQTAMTLGRKYKIKPELAVEASVAQLLEVAQWTNAKGAVLIVGHQPVLGQTVAHLLGIESQDWTVRKGAVWWLRYRERDALPKTFLVTVQSPEIL